MILCVELFMHKKRKRLEKTIFPDIIILKFIYAFHPQDIRKIFGIFA